jgi:hypothetical protein
MMPSAQTRIGCTSVKIRKRARLIENLRRNPRIFPWEKSTNSSFCIKITQAHGNTTHGLKICKIESKIIRSYRYASGVPDVYLGRKKEGVVVGNEL